MSVKVSLLKNGERLSREEFHLRYKAMDENIKAELIKGIVFFQTKVTATHAQSSAKMISWLGFYSIKNLHSSLSNHVTFIINGKNEFQPEAILRIDEDFGGKSWVNDDDYLEGAPELIVEISASTASYDLHDKLEIYEQKGVQEYIVWRVLDNQIDWFSLEKGKYQRLSANNQGIIESKVFAGLRLNIKAMLEENLQQVLTDLQKGLQSKKYKEFAKQLSVL